MINLCHDTIRVKRLGLLFYTILRKEIWKKLKKKVLRIKPKRNGTTIPFWMIGPFITFLLFLRSKSKQYYCMVSGRHEQQCLFTCPTYTGY